MRQKNIIFASMSKTANMAKWLKRRWIFVAWGFVALAAVAVAAMQCGRSQRAMAVSPAMTDSLMSIYDSRLQRVDYEGFCVYYNKQWHLPACVAYELTKTESRGTMPRHDKWASDSSVDGCATNNDYVHSRYDRGHMAPAGDLKWSATAMQQSFTLTNACPQDHSLNEGAWQRLEEKVREWVQRDNALIVLAGPIVASSDTTTLNGKGKVRIPGAFYKIVLAHKTQPMRVAAFIYPNKACEGTLRDYAVTVRDIEQRTGIDFFTALPREEQDRLETIANLNSWLN